MSSQRVLQSGSAGDYVSDGAHDSVERGVTGLSPFLDIVIVRSEH